MSLAAARSARRILVTGSSGFIGHAVARRALADGAEVLGVDDHCELYYSAALKDLRRDDLIGREGFAFRRDDITDLPKMCETFVAFRPTDVVHLAAHAAVMPSFEEPLRYMHTNVMGTQVVLEAARRLPDLERFIYASTSSVYGRSKDGAPFHEDLPTTTPISVYGASKVANEATAQIYADRYGLPVTGLRLFKVYGPWGRPETVFYKFVDRIYHGEPVRMHNFGEITHPFTYVDDAVDGVMAALDAPAYGGAGRHPIYNIGNSGSEPLGRCVDLMEAALGREAVREHVALPPGDRHFSIADVSLAGRELGYRVRVPVDQGIPRLVHWYLENCAAHGLRF